MRTRTMQLLVTSVLISACAIGQNAGDWSVSRTAAGATAVVVTRSAVLKGELIEVSKDGVVVLRSDHTLAFASFAAIRGLELMGLGPDFVVGRALSMSENNKARFAMLSHFPQGMPAAVRAQLLAAAGQKEVVIIE